MNLGGASEAVVFCGGGRNTGAANERGANDDDEGAAADGHRAIEVGCDADDGKGGAATEKTCGVSAEAKESGV